MAPRPREVGRPRLVMPIQCGGRQIFSVNLVRSEIGQAAASATVEPIEGKTK